MKRRIEPFLRWAHTPTANKEFRSKRFQESPRNMGCLHTICCIVRSQRWVWLHHRLMPWFHLQPFYNHSHVGVRYNR